MEYRDIFFTGCTDFTTPEDLFGILARRFHEVEGTGAAARHPEDRIAIQYKYVVDQTHRTLVTDLLD